VETNLKLKEVMEYLNAREKLHDWKAMKKDRRYRKREYRYVSNPFLTRSLG
jgi:hypothetical protein